MKPGPGFSTRLLTGRSGSWSLVSGPRDLSWCQITGGGGGDSLTVAFVVQGILKLVFASECGQSQGQGGLKSGFGLLWAGWSHRLWKSGFSAFGV